MTEEQLKKLEQRYATLRMAEGQAEKQAKSSHDNFMMIRGQRMESESMLAMFKKAPEKELPKDKKLEAVKEEKKA